MKAVRVKILKGLEVSGSVKLGLGFLMVLGLSYLGNDPFRLMVFGP